MSTGIRGNGGAVLTLALIDPTTGTPGSAEEHSDDAKQVRLTSEDKDDSDLTFAEAAQGETKDYTLAITSIQSTVAGSLWRTFWDNPGGEFACVYGPHGNATPTADKPHFTFTIKADGRPEVGGEATREKSRFEFEYEALVTTPIVLEDGTV